MAKGRLSRLVRIHKAIGHPVRLRLLALLREGPLCVCQMTGVVKLAPSTVSQHLSELRNADLVTERKAGRWVEYRLSETDESATCLAGVWAALSGDPEVDADLVIAREVRRVPMQELCDAELDLSKLSRPRLTAAVAKAAGIRERLA